MGVRTAIAHALGLLPPGLIRRVNRWQWTGPLARLVVQWGANWIRNQDLTIRYGVGAGLRLNTFGSSPGYALGTSEPLVQEALQTYLKPGDTFYDIGANVGFFSILAGRLVGPEGRVVAFEPSPRNAVALRHNVALNGLGNVEVVEKAVHAASGSGLLLLAPEPIWDRLSTTCHRQEVTGEVEVAMTSLDDYLAAPDVRPPTLIKIDVEGSELEALAGMARTLETCKPVVICEVDGKNKPIAALLRRHGYTLHALESEAPVEDAPWWIHVVAIPG